MLNVKKASAISITLVALISILYFYLFKMEHDGFLLSILKFNTLIAFMCISPILYIIIVSNFDLPKNKTKHIVLPIFLVSMFNLFGNVFCDKYELPITVLKQDKIIKNIEHISNNFDFSKKIIAKINNKEYVYKNDIFKVGDLIQFTTKRSHDDKVEKNYLCNNKNKCTLAIKYNEPQKNRTPKVS